MHYFADRLNAGPFARTYMLGHEQMMRKKSIKSRKYRGHSPLKRQNILILHQNPLQHPISSLSACHVIIYCDIIYFLGLVSTFFNIQINTTFDKAKLYLDYCE